MVQLVNCLSRTTVLYSYRLALFPWVRERTINSPSFAFFLLLQRRKKQKLRYDSLSPPESEASDKCT